MRLLSVAILLPIFLAGSAQGQGAQRNHNASASPAVVRIKALQSQVERQQVEIDALRLRLGKLQQEFKDLTEMLADQETDSDDDRDAEDDSDVAVLLAHSHARPAKRNATQIAHRAIVVWTDKTPSK